eukprot:4858923-Pyramimonas_sp.AAC.1
MGPLPRHQLNVVAGAAGRGAGEGPPWPDLALGVYNQRARRLDYIGLRFYTSMSKGAWRALRKGEV